MTSFTIDLGAGPASEPCAQLGRTPGFPEVNRLEVEAYQAALIARYGSPPKGCRFDRTTNHHDFGTYTTLALRVDTAATSDVDVRTYSEAVEEGIDRWHHVGFTPPASYSGSTAVRLRAIDETIAGAINSTRPLSNPGALADDFATLHANLTAAYPEHAIGGRLNPSQVTT